MEVLKTYEAKGIDSSPSLKDNTNSHVNVDGEMAGVRMKLNISQLYIENYSHLSKAESGRKGLLQIGFPTLSSKF